MTWEKKMPANPVLIRSIEGQTDPVTVRIGSATLTF